MSQELTYEQELSVIFNSVENHARDNKYSPAQVKMIFNVGLLACKHAGALTAGNTFADDVEKQLKETGSASY